MSFINGSFLHLTQNTPITPQVYSAATDWISITGAVDNQCIFLVSDATIPTYTIRTEFTASTGNIYINWGDGVVDTITATTATDTSHTYTSGGTSCSRGYNTWKITVSGDSGNRITVCRFIQPTGEYSETPSGLLQAWYGDNTVTTMANYFNEQNASPIVPPFPLFELCRMPSVMLGSDALFRPFFNGCNGLQKVILPTSTPNITDLSYAFYECNVLFDLSPFPLDITGNTSFEQTFYNCYALYKVDLPPSLPNVTRIDRMHQDNRALGYYNMPEFANCTNWSLAFTGCRNLRTLNIKTLKAGASHNFASAFSNCSKLQTITFPNSANASADFSDTFTSCETLISITFPPDITITTLAFTFFGCANIKEINLPNSLSGCTSMQSTFQNCRTLQSIDLPSTGFTNRSMLSTFQNCHNISSIVIPNSYFMNTLVSTFRDCYALTNLVLPSDMSYVTSMSNMCNNCYSLENVTFATTVGGGPGTIDSMFSGCYSLKEFTFPSSMNSTTSFGSAFLNCRSLQKVTMPTGTTANNTWNGTFSGCFSLNEVTMPTTSAVNASWVNTFLSCYSLRRIVLPTTQMNTTSTIQNMVSGARSLTGITNLDYIGNRSTTGTTYINGTGFGTDARNIKSLDFYCKFNRLELQGTGTGTDLSDLNSLRLRNNGSGQYGGISPQINISFTNLSQAALVQVFNDLPTVTSKTINITSATGAAALTAGERAIATGKGWTITG
jgi:hypothetical protein